MIECQLPSDAALEAWDSLAVNRFPGTAALDSSRLDSRRPAALPRVYRVPYGSVLWQLSSVCL